MENGALYRCRSSVGIPLNSRRKPRRSLGGYRLWRLYTSRLWRSMSRRLLLSVGVDEVDNVPLTQVR